MPSKKIFLMLLTFIILAISFVWHVWHNVSAIPDVLKPDANGLKYYIEKVRPDFKLGVFVNDNINNEKFQKTVLDNFNAVTVGIYMKSSQPSKDQWAFTMDKTIDFAKKNNLWVKMHPLFGQQQYTADWVKEGNFSAEQLREIMEDRVKVLMTKYKDKVAAVDVLNEILGLGNQFWTTNGGKNVWMNIGMTKSSQGEWPVYVEEAFRLARKYGGDNIKLIYNDSHNEVEDSKMFDRTLKFVTMLKQAGIPIDGVGLQFHSQVKDGCLYELNDNTKIDFDSFSRVMHKFSGVGVEVYVSEFDVHLPQNPTDSDLDLQAQAYRSILERCLNEPACKALTFWGLTDDRSWIPPQNGFNGKPLMFDENYEPKSAYTETLNFLKDRLK